MKITFYKCTSVEKEYHVYVYVMYWLNLGDGASKIYYYLFAVIWKQ